MHICSHPVTGARDHDPAKITMRPRVFLENVLLPFPYLDEYDFITSVQFGSVANILSDDALRSEGYALWFSVWTDEVPWLSSNITVRNIGRRLQLSLSAGRLVGVHPIEQAICKWECFRLYCLRNLVTQDKCRMLLFNELGQSFLGSH